MVHPLQPIPQSGGLTVKGSGSAQWGSHWTHDTARINSKNSLCRGQQKDRMRYERNALNEGTMDYSFTCVEALVYQVTPNDSLGH
jgi:hypothetical protein